MRIMLVNSSLRKEEIVMKKFFSLSVLMLSFVFAFNLYAKPVKQQNEKINEPQYLKIDSKKIFEMNKNKDEFLNLYSYLSEFKPSKPRGEFETKEEYKKRLAKEEMEKGKNIKLDVFYVKAGFPKYEYNNDKLFYTVTVLSRSYRKNVQYADNVIYEERENLGSYIAANAFGEKVNVNKFKTSRYVINVFELDKHLKYYLSYEFTFKVDPKKAQDLKNNMSLIYEVIPYEPKDKNPDENKYNNIVTSIESAYEYRDMNSFTFVTSRIYKPTITLPNDVKVDEKIINTKATNVYIIDNRNNEILVKF